MATFEENKKDTKVDKLNNKQVITKEYANDLVKRYAKAMRILGLKEAKTNSNNIVFNDIITIKPNNDIDFKLTYDYDGGDESEYIVHIDKDDLQEKAIKVYGDKYLDKKYDDPLTLIKELDSEPDFYNVDNKIWNYLYEEGIFQMENEYDDYQSSYDAHLENEWGAKRDFEENLNDGLTEDRAFNSRFNKWAKSWGMSKSVYSPSTNVQKKEQERDADLVNKGYYSDYHSGDKIKDNDKNIKEADDKYFSSKPTNDIKIKKFVNEYSDEIKSDIDNDVYDDYNMWSKYLDMFTIDFPKNKLTTSQFAIKFFDEVNSKFGTNFSYFKESVHHINPFDWKEPDEPYIEMDTSDFKQACTYEDEDEPDISWLQMNHSVDIDKHDHETYIFGDVEDLQKFIDYYMLSDYGVEIKMPKANEDYKVTFRKKFDNSKIKEVEFKTKEEAEKYYNQMKDIEDNDYADTYVDLEENSKIKPQDMDYYLQHPHYVEYDNGDGFNNAFLSNYEYNRLKNSHWIDIKVHKKLNKETGVYESLTEGVEATIPNVIDKKVGKKVKPSNVNKINKQNKLTQKDFDKILMSKDANDFEIVTIDEMKKW